MKTLKEGISRYIPCIATNKEEHASFSQEQPIKLFGSTHSNPIQISNEQSPPRRNSLPGDKDGGPSPGLLSTKSGQIDGEQSQPNYLSNDDDYPSRYPIENVGAELTEPGSKNDSEDIEAYTAANNSEKQSSTANKADSTDKASSYFHASEVHATKANDKDYLEDFTEQDGKLIMREISSYSKYKAQLNEIFNPETIKSNKKTNEHGNVSRSDKFQNYFNGLKKDRARYIVCALMLDYSSGKGDDLPWLQRLSNIANIKDYTQIEELKAISETMYTFLDRLKKTPQEISFVSKPALLDPATRQNHLDKLIGISFSINEEITGLTLLQAECSANLPDSSVIIMLGRFYSQLQEITRLAQENFVADRGLNKAFSTALMIKYTMYDDSNPLDGLIAAQVGVDPAVPGAISGTLATLMYSLLFVGLSKESRTEQLLHLAIAKNKILCMCKALVELHPNSLKSSPELQKNIDNILGKRRSNLPKIFKANAISSSTSNLLTTSQKYFAKLLDPESSKNFPRIFTKGPAESSGSTGAPIENSLITKDPTKSSRSAGAPIDELQRMKVEHLLIGDNLSAIQAFNTYAQNLPKQIKSGSFGCEHEIDLKRQLEYLESQLDKTLTDNPAILNGISTDECSKIKKNIMKNILLDIKHETSGPDGERGDLLYYYLQYLHEKGFDLSKHFQGTQQYDNGLLDKLIEYDAHDNEKLQPINKVTTHAAFRIEANRLFSQCKKHEGMYLIRRICWAYYKNSNFKDIQIGEKTRFLAALIKPQLDDDMTGQLRQAEELKGHVGHFWANIIASTGFIFHNKSVMEAFLTQTIRNLAQNVLATTILTNFFRWTAFTGLMAITGNEFIFGKTKSFNSCLKISKVLLSSEHAAIEDYKQPPASHTAQKPASAATARNSHSTVSAHRAAVPDTKVMPAKITAPVKSLTESPADTIFNIFTQNTNHHYNALIKEHAEKLDYITKQNKKDLKDLTEEQKNQIDQSIREKYAKDLGYITEQNTKGLKDLTEAQKNLLNQKIRSDEFQSKLDNLDELYGKKFGYINENNNILTTEQRNHIHQEIYSHMIISYKGPRKFTAYKPLIYIIMEELDEADKIIFMEKVWKPIFEASKSYYSEATKALYDTVQNGSLREFENSLSELPKDIPPLIHLLILVTYIKADSDTFRSLQKLGTLSIAILGASTDPNATFYFLYRRGFKSRFALSFALRMASSAFWAICASLTIPHVGVPVMVTYLILARIAQVSIRTGGDWIADFPLTNSNRAEIGKIITSINLADIKLQNIFGISANDGLLPAAANDANSTLPATNADTQTAEIFEDFRTKLKQNPLFSQIEQKEQDKLITDFMSMYLTDRKKLYEFFDNHSELKRKELDVIDKKLFGYTEAYKETMTTLVDPLVELNYELEIAKEVKLLNEQLDHLDTEDAKINYIKTELRKDFNSYVTKELYAAKFRRIQLMIEHLDSNKITSISKFKLIRAIPELINLSNANFAFKTDNRFFNILRILGVLVAGLMGMPTAAPHIPVVSDVLTNTLLEYLIGTSGDIVGTVGPWFIELYGKSNDAPESEALQEVMQLWKNAMLDFLNKNPEVIEFLQAQVQIYKESMAAAAESAKKSGPINQSQTQTQNSEKNPVASYELLQKTVDSLNKMNTLNPFGTSSLDEFEHILKLKQRSGMNNGAMGVPVGKQEVVI